MLQLIVYSNIMTQEIKQWGQIHMREEAMGKDDEFSYEHADVEIPNKSIQVEM